MMLKKLSEASATTFGTSKLRSERSGAAKCMLSVSMMAALVFRANVGSSSTWGCFVAMLSRF